MDFEQVKISTTVPVENADKVREALGKAGAGTVGKYSFCSFSSRGVGRFKPSASADPHIGEAGKLEAVEEERIEVICPRTVAPKAIAALKATHPYEEVILEITPLIGEDKL